MFVGRVFVDLQKAFDTVDPNIFLLKLTRYGIRDQKTICNNWLWLWNTKFSMSDASGICSASPFF